MQVVDGVLTVTVGGSAKTVALPVVASNAKVKVWAVPVAYRVDGLFVSVTESGHAEEVPACSLADCEFLGEVKLEAQAPALLEAAKAAKRIEINAACDVAVAALAASYPEREIQSWPQQVKEAEALTASPSAAAPLLTSIAAARALPIAELASRVLAKMNGYAAVSGALIGRRQAAEDLINIAATPEDVASVAF